MNKESRIIETGIFQRFAEMETETVSTESRTVEMAFSSEAPIERHFGTEVLDHAPDSVRLGRLNSNGPVLFNHNIDDVIGVVESARIDKDKVGRAQIRFGKSKRADSVFQDVKDGILKSV